jgi:hypothetical protein
MLLSLGLLAGCGQPVTKKCDTQVPLIPRKVLFGNPEKTAPQISPDGKRLVYLAPVNGVLNVWVKTVGKNDDQPVSNTGRIKVETKIGTFSALIRNQNR